jgi:hypothetical protein
MSAPHAATQAVGSRFGLARRFLPPALALGVLCFTLFAGATSARAAASTFTSSSIFPINLPVDACGEPVQLSGNLHDLFHVTFDGAGGAVLKVLDNPQGVSGVDLLTGAKYQGTGETEFVETFAAGGTFTDTFVNNFKIIGQGTSPNYLVHENFHITVNPDGTVTSFHDNFSITCH